MQNDTLRLTTLAAPKHLAVEAARRLGIRSVPQLIPIQPTPSARSRHCYANVREHVKANGGEVVFGWSVYYFPRVLIECIHHAIWRSPTRKLIDVTPDKRGARVGMFLPDIDVRNHEGRLTTKYFPLTDEPVILEYVAAHERPSEVYMDEYGLPRPGIPPHLQARFGRAVLSAWHPDAPCVCGKGKALKNCCHTKLTNWVRDNAV